ncbi:SIGIRR [Mytilus edulis]|uniref:SIGIRR n=1 Tax=Mytilus edulis TaxID=6550 RepID=A0A8S3Q016_MYTED|nr:SIGIRR [Mytilus edulis]
MTVLLEGNPLVCTYASLHFGYLSQKVKLDSNGSYSCVINDGNITTTNAVYNQLRIKRIRCITTVWVIFSATLFGVLLFYILVGYRYKLPTILVFIYRNGQSTFPEVKEETLEYDAYVAYCDGDYKWVYGPLRIFLEERRNYKLGLRDGGGVIAGEHRLCFKQFNFKMQKECVNNDWAYYEETVGIEHFLGLQARIIVINL